MNRADLLQRIQSINVWKRRSERAPHKPLLLLYALAHAAHGDRELPYRQIDEPLRELLQEFGPSRKQYHPELPFWYLQTDGLWEVPGGESLPRREGSSNPLRSTLLDHDVIGRLPADVYEAIRADPSLLYEVAHSLLQSHFADSLHDDILSAVGLSIDSGTSGQRRRDPKFRERVLRAYEHKCAICGFQAHLGHVDIGLEAAHIRWHQAGGDDDEPNGLALCVMHHKLFDRGALTVVDEDLTVQVSQHVHGGSGFEEWVTGFHGQPLRVPQHPDFRPAPSNLSWHWRQVFRQPPRWDGER